MQKVDMYRNQYERESLKQKVYNQYERESLKQKVYNQYERESLSRKYTTNMNVKV